MSNKRNLPSISSRNISKLVENTSNRLNTTTEKVKDDLVLTLSNQLKDATEREKRMMEGEMMLYI